MISVVIPSYNRRDGMLALLADVFRQENADFEVMMGAPFPKSLSTLLR